MFKPGFNLKKTLTVSGILLGVLVVVAGFLSWQALGAVSTARKLVDQGKVLQASRLMCSSPVCFLPGAFTDKIERKINFSLFKALLKHARHFEERGKFGSAAGCVKAARKFARGKKQNAYLKSVFKRLQNSIQVSAQKLNSQFDSALTTSQRREVACKILDLKADGRARKVAAWTNSLGMEFEYIPEGVFLMGSFRAGPPNSLPVHPVHIAKGFYISKYEVPAKICARFGFARQSPFDNENFPVVNISWNEAQKFVEALNALEESQKAGIIYRLPTEAEWEYACRGGVAAKSGRASFIEFFMPGVRLVEVDQTLPNTWGVCGMLGNVAEWCSDWYSGQYYETSPFSQPENLELGSSRCIRGGAWRFAKRFEKPFYRFFAKPSSRSKSTGIRLVAQLGPTV